jgi:uncharacterized membrane protein YgcG
MRGRAVLCVVFLFAGSLTVFGDFKYTQSAKMTGGAMAGAMKFVGVFSKQAREPMVTTTSYKGSRMRTDQGEGRIQIIDLEGRRIINIDTQKHTYSVVTFDEMRDAMARAKQRAQEQAHQKQQNQNVKVVPKIQVTPTDNTKVLLNQTTKEVKVRLDMEMQSDDPNQKAQSATMYMTSDAWIAPSVPGSEEVQEFSAKMAQELDWAPGAMLGESPQMQEAMTEFRKNASALKGFPLEQLVSFGMEGTGQGGATSGSQTQGGGGTTAASTGTQSGGETQSSGGGGLLGKKSLGGMFGGFGKKKQSQESSSTGSGGSSGGTTAQQGGNSSSLMDMDVVVTSYSSDSLDQSLFEIPAGYTEVKADADKLAQGRP